MEGRQNTGRDYNITIHSNYIPTKTPYLGSNFTLHNHSMRLGTLATRDWTSKREKLEVEALGVWSSGEDK